MMCSTTDKSTHACILLELMMGGLFNNGSTFCVLSCLDVTQVDGYLETCLLTRKVTEMKCGSFLLFDRWWSYSGSGC